MHEFVRETFYILLFLGIYGTATLVWVGAHYLNKWFDRLDAEDEERRRNGNGVEK